MKTEAVISTISRIRDAANELIVTELTKRGAKGIAPSHGDILVVLYHHGPQAMGQLAARIGRKKNTITVLVEKLRAAGYVELQKSSEDARVTIVELTEKGEAFQSDFQEISTLLLDRVWGNIPKKDREQIMAGLQRIADNMAK